MGIGGQCPPESSVALVGGDNGRRSSPLDDIRPERWTAQFTTELLQLLWILEATVAGYSEQVDLLNAVLAGKLFTADELPDVPEQARRPPGDESGTFWEQEP